MEKRIEDKSWQEMDKKERQLCRDCFKTFIKEREARKQVAKEDGFPQGYSHGLIEHLASKVPKNTRLSVAIDCIFHNR